MSFDKMLLCLMGLAVIAMMIGGLITQQSEDSLHAQEYKACVAAGKTVHITFSRDIECR